MWTAVSYPNRKGPPVGACLPSRSQSRMSPPLPNRDLLHLLADKYFRNALNREEESVVSSHWRLYGGLFDIDMDSAGNLLEVVGAGIGTMKWPKGWKGAFQRLLDYLCIFLHIIRLPDRRFLLQLRREGTGLCRKMGLHFTFDAFRQICTLAIIERNLGRGGVIKGGLNILMIGDGYGFLSALFKLRFPHSTVVLIDLGKTLLLQSYNCQMAFPQSVHMLPEKIDERSQADFVYCPAEQLEALKGFTFDIAVNIASMQEMAPTIVERYFAFLRKRLRTKNLFYCCNRERKTMPGGEVSEFTHYPWKPEDQYVINGPCPWHQYFMAVGRSGNEAVISGVKIPFVHLYDGIHLHRLVVMATDHRDRNKGESEGSRNPQDEEGRR